MDKLSKLNQWLSLVANIGVLIGIVFIALEIQQNTIATQLETVSNFQSGFAEIELMIASNPEFAELLRKGRDGENTTGAEKVRLQAFYRTVLRSWQTNFLQYRSGSLSEGSWNGTRVLITQIFREDRGLKAHWRIHRDEFIPAFNDLVEVLMSSGEIQKENQRDA